MVKNRFIQITLGIVWFGMIALAGCQNKLPDVPGVVAQPTALSTGDSAAADSKTEVSRQTDPQSGSSLTATKNGLRAEIQEYDFDPDHPSVTICADLPSVADWLPGFTASYNDDPIEVWMWRLIDPHNTAYKERHRCYEAMLKEHIIQPGEPGELIFRLEHFALSEPVVDQINGPWVFTINTGGK